ncbi:hypothetical protein KAM448_29240 [Aeromonas caviae]|jgi:hypothetical protein|uniref:hypothetical protein n=1 Tax=Aeromonas caviae TaxID=648 RepID=UPI0009ADCE36|nr:hypothetical protein [Aeromonas caviae]WNV60205.1 hypothetical protein LNGCBEGE_00009 [Aeromonas caviae]GJB12962.1 hypothetical protein KAM362_35220 [Aeromonas caviae]GJB25612.1 hypothetical protein KAM365_33620 [Aeromonas caviae]GJB34328.1 hypothetical protein KAM367_34300 [Aeromonas caviae]GKQ80630.1 hypothetical protein KAM448_29240 [Aeromonas caviae]
MAVNFEYKSGILEAGDTGRDVSWCWFKGDLEATRAEGGEPVGSISVPPSASVTVVKSLIREDAKKR